VSVSAEVRVRVARLADEAALAEVQAAAWTPESGFPSVRERDDGRPFFSDDHPPDAYIVAELGSRVAGYIKLGPPTHLPENSHVLQVQGLAVDPAAQRRGVAAGLLAAAEQRARGQRARKLSLRVLSSNQGAIRLYEKLGFRREGVLLEEFCINGAYVDDVIMAKRL
jgi:ribosomal protein S18 acetylase RimI-like enzyme